MLREDVEDAVRRVREVVRETIAPRATEVDREARWPEESLRALLDAGLGGLVVPKELGGAGLGLRGLVAVCEEIGWECASSAICFGMHCVATAVLAAKPNESIRERYLTPICRGEHVTSLALSEPGSGAHFYLPTARMREAAGGYLVSGRKCFVTNGGHADSYVVSVISEEAGSMPGHFSCVLVPGDSQGLAWGDPWRGMGMRGNSSRAVQLEDVAIPVENLLGEEGDQIWYVFHVVAPYFLASMAGTYVGVAAGALRAALRHLEERTYEHSGESLADQVVLQHRVGVLWAAVERSRQLTRWAAGQGDAGGASALPGLCSAKAEVADMAVYVVNECMSLMGGRSYAEGGEMSRRLRDCRAAPVMSPTTDILRLWTGRAVLGLPLLGD